MTTLELGVPEPAGPAARVSGTGGAWSVDDFTAERAAAPAAAPALRDDSWAIEYSYLEQIRKLKAEIHELKAALRLERDRYRRLHALLRGDF